VSSLSNAGSFWNQVLRRGASALGDAPGSELGGELGRHSGDASHRCWRSTRCRARATLSGTRAVPGESWGLH
jgi:hypothetical protein